MKRFDLMILGGGPGGYSAAITAAKRGLSVVLFEGESLGGTCLNVGCIPTKYLYDKASALEKIRAMTADGIFRDAGCFSFRAIARGRGETTERLRRGVETLLKSAGVTVVKAYAELKEPHRVLAGGEEYEGGKVILATGSEPNRLPIPGAELCIDSTEALALKKVPKRLCVIGGGVIGLELASAYASFGAEVTVLEYLPRLLPQEYAPAVDRMRDGLLKRGIEIVTGARVTAISEAGGARRVAYVEDGSTQTVEADVVLMAAGRRPRLTGIDAERLGLKLGKGGAVLVDDRMRTNLDGVYAIGDLAGGFQLAHAAYAEGEAAVKDVLGEGEALSLAGIPHCVYVQPCFASVGHTEESARAAGFTPVVGRFDYSGSGMALAEGASGCVYAMMDEVSERVLGFTIVGDGAAELISFAGAMVKSGYTADEISDLVVAHPSLAEMLKEAALSAFGRAIHK